MKIYEHVRRKGEPAKIRVNQFGHIDSSDADSIDESIIMFGLKVDREYDTRVDQCIRLMVSPPEDQ